MEQLLIVEDDIGLNQGLCKALKADDRQIISCHDLKAAREQLLCGGVSLILLDINLPDGSGLELLREVKENIPGVPVILLTANDTDLDIVDGLERGADDYITKPFSMRELIARVGANIRRTAMNTAAAATAAATAMPVAGDLSIDTDSHQVFRDGKPLELTTREYELLTFLASHPNKVYSRIDLMEQVWNYGYVGDDQRTVDVTVRRLREKIEENPASPKYILTRRGVGYYFAV